MKRFRLPLVAIAVLLMCRACMADAFLERLSGQWSGGGWARQTPEAPREAVRCRLSFIPKGSSGSLEVTGKCAGAGSQSQVSARLTPLGNGLYRATWSAAGWRLDHMSGRRSGDRLLFRWSSQEGNATEVVTGEFGLALFGSALSLKTRQTTPKPAEIGELELRRR
ncbi:hypothetical protein [Roseibium sediminicola]|uniref:Protease inhibitor Inh n=1 Tax=Roseibium sediminicola TaxID=2933272 RepID=A0ABT0GZL6_9HYPH|nr:hypothetical protein [Roseibium sp. CAU 1639]MCK7614771.1 hypothetical protein [Roseibium sp. CAU 1639]